MSTRILVSQMDQFFLYLPFYYALHKGFFGHVPSKYEFEMRLAPDGSDDGAIECLMDCSAKNADVHFAICDPSRVLLLKKRWEASPVLLASIVTNASFWAVDRREHVVRHFQDLAQYQRIVAFKKGTTSFSIAAQAYRDADKEPSIEVVQPGRELTRITEGGPCGLIAISPDVLGIEELLWNDDKFHVDLAIGTTARYANVLVTGLMSRSDFIEPHRELIMGMLRGLQRAMLLARFQDADIIQFAEDRFNMTSRNLVHRALRRAIDAGVYPATIEVSKAHFLNAARALLEGHGKDFAKEDEQKLDAKYEAISGKYQGLTRTAVQAEIQPLFSQEAATPMKGARFRGRTLVTLLLLLSFGVVLGSMGSAAIDWATVTFVGSIGVVSSSVLGGLCLSLKSRQVLVNVVLVVGAISVFVLAQHRHIDWLMAVGLLIAITIATLQVWASSRTE